MLQKNIIENAYTAIIKLTEHCDLDDISTCASLYHLMRFIRAEIRDFDSNDKQFNKMYDIITINSARLKKLADIKTVPDVEMERNTDIPMQIANTHLSINWLICKALREKSAENYVRLYNIAALYAQKLSCVTDKSISPLIDEIRRDIRWLDAKINPDNKISEGDDFYAYYYNH